jgi:hypothetical protein
LKNILPNLIDETSNEQCVIPTLLAYKDSVRIINYKNYNAIELLNYIGVDEKDSNADKLQSKLLHSINSEAKEIFTQSLQNSPVATASFLSVASPEASAFLFAKPKLPHLNFNYLEFRTALRLRFRIQIQRLPNLRCSCKNQPPIDEFGDHMLACKKGKEIYDIHNTMVQEIASFCRSNGLSARIEPTHVFNADEESENKRPDLEIRGLSEIPLLADVGICTTTHENLSYNQARIMGRSADNYASIKSNKYEHLAEAAGFSFSPFIFENRGLWQKDFLLFFHKVIEHGSKVNNIPFIISKVYWRRRISSTLHKIVAKCIISKTKRAYSPSYHDESNYSGAILDEANGANFEELDDC